MKNLLNEELLKVEGGAFSKWLLAGIGAGVVFLCSVLYGFIHPNKC